MGHYGNLKQVKTTIHETHGRLQESGEIKDRKSGGSARLVYLWNRYKRTIAVAASIAGFTALLISGMVTALSPKAQLQQRQVENLVKQRIHLSKKRIARTVS